LDSNNPARGVQYNVHLSANALKKSIEILQEQATPRQPSGDNDNENPQKGIRRYQFPQDDKLPRFAQIMDQMYYRFGRGWSGSSNALKGMLFLAWTGRLLQQAKEEEVSKMRAEIIWLLHQSKTRRGSCPGYNEYGGVKTTL
jgi:hypothetical protein